MRFDRLRLLLSTTLVILFMITASSVLFFSFGYRFSFERGIFIHTGSITIKSNPKDVRILVDGKEVPSGLINIINQSYHITGLLPGEHFLRIEADGYRPWEKKVTIGSGISTEFWNILLLRETYPTTEIASGNFEKMFPSPEQRFLALVSNTDSGASVDVLEKSTGETTRVVSIPDHRFDTEGLENIEWTEDGSEFLLPVRTGQGASDVFIVDRETGTSVDVRKLIGSKDILRGARWHPKNDGSFLILSGSSLLLVRPEATTQEQLVTLIGEDVAAYDISEKYLYLLDQESASVRIVDIGNEGVATPRILTGPFQKTDSSKQLVLNAYDEKRIIVYGYEGPGFLWNDTGDVEPEIFQLGNEIRSAQFSNDGKKVLFSDGNQISVIFSRDWDTQPTRKTGESVQIVRLSSEIPSVEWNKNYEHVLFSAGENLRIAELDHRDHRQMDTVLSFPGRTVKQILPSFDENLVTLLVLDEKTGTSQLLSIAFPEDSGLFGG